MIARYEVPEITEIWSDFGRFRSFLKIELALLRALEESGRIPAGVSAQFQNAQIKPDRIQEIEKTTQHDVIAFCSSITEQVDASAARFFHFGATSSDIIDTALSLQMKDSISLVIAGLQALIQSLEKRVQETKDLLCLGRSHGMAAEPMIFAQKFLSSQAEFQRRLQDYQNALKTELTGQMSGAVGNYTVLTPEIESKVMAQLGLPAESVSTQVIPRDHLAKVVSIGALTAVALERLAVEIRHLHHSDIGEVHEGFKAGQKGSSTMPHKKNPVSSENITGISRVLRSHLGMALENSVLWHERDISHSSAERLFLPDHFGLLVYSLRRMTDVVQNLVIHRDVIEGKVRKQFQILSSGLLHALIEQVPASSRDELYSIVQAAAFQASSLEEMLQSIQTQLTAKGSKADISAMTWESMKTLYQERFQGKL